MSQTWSNEKLSVPSGSVFAFQSHTLIYNESLQKKNSIIDQSTHCSVCLQFSSTLKSTATYYNVVLNMNQTNPAMYYDA